MLAAFFASPLFVLMVFGLVTAYWAVTSFTTDWKGRDYRRPSNWIAMTIADGVVVGLFLASLIVMKGASFNRLNVGIIVLLWLVTMAFMSWSNYLGGELFMTVEEARRLQEKRTRKP